MMPTAHQLYDVIDSTWPAASYQTIGPWLIREGRGGGQRVSATIANGPFNDTDIATAEQAMQALDQPSIFMIRAGDDALDAALAARGYPIVDPVNLYVTPTDQLATERPPRVTAFCVWPPLAIQHDIWAKGGIGAGRIDVMLRAKDPKTTILGRLNDHPAGTAYVGIHQGIAMLHALEILPHQRKQRMGVYAMRQAGFWAQENGARYFSVVCTQANAGANALYSSLGMALVGQYHYRRK